MGSKKERDEIRFVKCPECNYEQADMGRGVQCEECGYGPMPTEGDEHGD
ncbi:hypothetical protein LCGC14_1930120 [marine sediment metagenome]|uniref:Uncharacterized protein n=1 Tax=marine sediment metagenome TaxID=412755 RepID=A0A0F9IL09_9ZZZZ